MDYRALARFRHLIRRFLCFSERAARKAGLQPRQHQLLLAVKGIPLGEKPTIGTLAWLLQLKHHSTVELVNRLGEKGLIRRQRSEADHREVLISITSRGDGILRKLTLLHREELRNTGPELVGALKKAFLDADPFEAAPPRRR